MTDARSAPGGIRRLEFHISYDCGQACLFCSEADRMKRWKAAPVTAAEMARVLAVKRRQGFDHVTFTGGEPTLVQGLAGALRAAKGLGYATYVTSNGSRLCERDFADRILPLIDELCLSVHGDDLVLHDELTRTPGGFERLRTALAHAGSREGLFLLTNTVVTAANWGRLEDILGFILRQKGVQHILLSHVAPEGRGARGYAGLAVPFSEWKKRIPGLARRAREKGVTLRFFGLPLCVLGSCAVLSNDLYFSPRVTVERGRVDGTPGLVEITSLKPTRRRVQPPVCAECSCRDLCGGVFERHLAEFGAKDLAPLRADSVLKGAAP
ncbi:MAG: radical SAM protein [Elusimicrobiota bacterium]|jgi:MoaA/NifB/PqqE/SkfB family radical SAM enzyme